MDLPEKAKRVPSAPVWNQSFPSPSLLFKPPIKFKSRLFLVRYFQSTYCSLSESTRSFVVYAIAETETLVKRRGLNQL